MYFLRAGENTKLIGRQRLEFFKLVFSQIIVYNLEKGSPSHFSHAYL